MNYQQFINLMEPFPLKLINKIENTAAEYHQQNICVYSNYLLSFENHVTYNFHFIYFVSTKRPTMFDMYFPKKKKTQIKRNH